MKIIITKESGDIYCYRACLESSTDVGSRGRSPEEAVGSFVMNSASFKPCGIEIIRNDTLGLSFEAALRKHLKNFDIDAASLLSDEIQEAEEAGYKITATEDRLWAALTDKIVAQEDSQR